MQEQVSDSKAREGGGALWGEIIVIFCHDESHQKDPLPVTMPDAARLHGGILDFPILGGVSSRTQSTLTEVQPPSLKGLLSV